MKLNDLSIAAGLFAVLSVAVASGVMASRGLLGVLKATKVVIALIPSRSAKATAGKRISSDD